MNTEVKKESNIVETFMGGAKKGFYIGIEQILPAMILGYMIIQFFTINRIS